MEDGGEGLRGVHDAAAADGDDEVVHAAPEFRQKGGDVDHVGIGDGEFFFPHVVEGKRLREDAVRGTVREVHPPREEKDARAGKGPAGGDAAERRKGPGAGVDVHRIVKFHRLPRFIE